MKIELRNILKPSNQPYKLKFEEFMIFCQLYDKHIEYYNNRIDEILSHFPEYSVINIYYDVSKCCFVFKVDSWMQYISDELFEPFDLYKDVEFISYKEQLHKLYKPTFFEAYRNGGQTFHAGDMQRLVQSLLDRLYEYKVNFKLVRRGI